VDCFEDFTSVCLLNESLDVQFCGDLAKNFLDTSGGKSPENLRPWNLWSGLLSDWEFSSEPASLSIYIYIDRIISRTYKEYQSIGPIEPYNKMEVKQMKQQASVPS
jgi:hypothetical protein